MFAVPVIDDGLYVAIGLYGLRDCVTGSGLNSIRDESVDEKKNVEKFIDQII